MKEGGNSFGYLRLVIKQRILCIGSLVDYYNHVVLFLRFYSIFRIFLDQNQPLPTMIYHVEKFLQNRKAIFDFLSNKFKNVPVRTCKLVNVMGIDFFGNLIQVDADLVQFVIHPFYLWNILLIQRYYLLSGLIKYLVTEKITHAAKLPVSDKIGESYLFLFTCLLYTSPSPRDG